jgi:hypothetical protein
MNNFLFVTDEGAKLARVFASGKHFQPSLIFAAKARRTLWCSTLIGYDLTHKYQTRLEKRARDKHSSLFGLLISHEIKVL